MLQERQKTLGPRFRATDYPPVTDLIDAHSADIVPVPIPDYSDFDPLMSWADRNIAEAEDEVQALREKYQREIHMAETQITRDLWARLRMALMDSAKRLTKKLNGEQKNFHATVITNIMDIVNVIPNLNVLGDDALEKFREEVAQKIGGIDPKDLSKSESMQTQTRDDIEAVLDKMSAYMA